MSDDGKPVIFNSITHGQLDLDLVIGHIKDFLENDPDAQYSLVIGSDSQEKKDAFNGTKILNLITAIIVRKIGHGGRYFWKKKQVRNIHTLREKIYAETIASLQFAENFVPILKKSLNGNSPKYQLEIHVDVGEHGQTRDMLKEVIGMVTGNGFVAKVKPDSFGATYVADKHT